MSRPKRRSVHFGSIALLTSLAICIAASTEKEPEGDLRRWRLIAEAGRIEEPLPRERENDSHKQEKNCEDILDHKDCKKFKEQGMCEEFFLKPGTLFETVVKKPLLTIFCKSTCNLCGTIVYC